MSSSVRHDPRRFAGALHGGFGDFAGLSAAFAEDVADVVRVGDELVVPLARLGERLVDQLAQSIIACRCRWNHAIIRRYGDRL